MKSEMPSAKHLHLPSKNHDDDKKDELGDEEDDLDLKSIEREVA